MLSRNKRYAYKKKYNNLMYTILLLRSGSYDKQYYLWGSVMKNSLKPSVTQTKWRMSVSLIFLHFVIQISRNVLFIISKMWCLLPWQFVKRFDLFSKNALWQFWNEILLWRNLWHRHFKVIRDSTRKIQKRCAESFL